MLSALCTYGCNDSTLDADRAYMLMLTFSDLSQRYWRREEPVEPRKGVRYQMDGNLYKAGDHNSKVVSTYLSPPEWHRLASRPSRRLDVDEESRVFVQLQTTRCELLESSIDKKFQPLSILRGFHERFITTYHDS